MDLRAYARWTGAAAEGAVLGQYRFEDFKKTEGMESVRLIVAEKDLAQARKGARRGEIAGAATNLARQVGSQPGNLLYPETLAAECRRVARREKLKVVFPRKSGQVPRSGMVVSLGMDLGFGSIG